MKLSFSRPSKSKPKPPENLSGDPNPQSTTQNRELITEFDPSKTLISHPKKVIIPPIENEWRPHKKMKNLDLPSLRSDHNDLEFELASSDIASADQGGISYGLTVRKVNGGGGDVLSKSDWSAMELKKFKSDVEKAPDEPTLEEYDDVAVEDFAKALMAGYGWREGRGIGRNAKEDIKIVEYKRHTAKEGLGFMADPPPAPKKEVERKKESVGVGVGMEVRVVSGEGMGLKGRVVEVSEGGIMVLRVSKIEEEVKVRVDDVAEVGSVEEEKCLRKLKELRIRDSSRGEKKNKDKDSSRKRSKDEGRRSDSEVRVEKEERRGSRVSWLTSHIRVRVISTELKGGRYYLKKGKVVDVIRPGVCDVSMDEGGQMVQSVDQDMLETALPRRGGMVLVLLGKHKGAYGSLVEKDTDRETGVVQDADSRELINVGLEQIAEFVGDPSYLGY